MKEIAIGKLCSTIKNTVNPQDHQNTLFNHYSIPIFDEGDIPEQILGAEIKSNKLVLDQPCILFSRLNPRIKRVWDLTHADLGQESIGSTEWVPFLVNDDKVLDSRYLYWYLLSDRFITVARAGVQAATKSRERVKKERLFEVKIPLPPLEEQKRIAAVLDKAAALRTKRQQALAKLDTLLQSVFLDMFGDPFHNPKGWETKSLKEVIVDGPQNGLYKHASHYGSGTPIIRIDSFYAGYVHLDQLKRVRIDNNTLDKYSVSPNDVLINRVNSREYLGKSALVPHDLEEPTVFESNMMRFAVDTNIVNPRYLVTLFQQTYFKNQVLSRCKDAVNQSSINQGDVKSFLIRIPPIGLQEHFASVVAKTQEQITSLQKNLSHLDSLFNSLQQRAFRGDL